MKLFEPFDRCLSASGVDLRVHGHRLRVRCGTANSLRLLEDTFYPSGTLGVRMVPSSAEHDEAFDLVLNEVPYERPRFTTLVEEIRQAADFVESYSPTVGAQADKVSLGQASVYFDVEEQGGLAFSIRRGRRLDLITTPSPSQQRRVTRIVRAWATGLAESDGDLCFHASAFVFEDLAYIVVGDAGAGKSTFSIAAAYFQPSTAAWLGNDRIYLSTAVPHMVTSSPMPLAVNKGTFAALGIEDFNTWPAAEAVPHDCTDWASYDGHTKWKLAPREVETFFRVSLATGAPLGGLIFPKVCVNSDYEVREVSFRTIVDVLERNCLSLRDTLYADDWLGVRPSAAPWRDRLQALKKSLEAVPLFTVTTTNPRDTRRAVDTVLRACAKSNAGRGAQLVHS